MADSTVMEFSKLKVTELRKELKTRGLSTIGDKAELIARLQSASVQDEYGLDSDELDSEGVLEDEVDEKSTADISLDDTHGHDSFHDELVEEEKIEQSKEPERKPKTREHVITPKSLKRKLISASEEKKENGEAKETGAVAKKVVLHRPPSVPATEPKSEKFAAPVAPMSKTNAIVVDKAPPSAEEPVSKLELRAKRFGLPLSDEQRKEARKLRFGATASAGGTSKSTTVISKAASSNSHLDKLKKRAERFGASEASASGASASKPIDDVTSKERLDKRRARFGVK